MVYKAEDLKNKPCVNSEHLTIKGVTQLCKRKFKAQLVIDSFTGKRQLSKTSNHLIDSLLYFELMNLILDQPSSLEELCTLGNYQELIRLTGVFQLFTNPIEYYFVLGRFLLKLVHDYQVKTKKDENLQTMITVRFGL